MVAPNIDIGSWTQATLHPRGPILPHRTETRDNEITQERVRELIATVRNWLQSNRVGLEHAAMLDSKIGNDRRIEGLDRIDEEKVLNLVDQLAYVSEIHGRWADDISEALDLLRSIRTNAAHWPLDANELILVLEGHLASLRRVEATMLEWSRTFGREFDRRNPKSLELPFEPLDMGETNSARLPTVL